MSKKTRIVIVGIGGVGGYFGGLLAKAYENDQTVEICFIARGAHLQQIKTQGLKVIKGDEKFIARPFMATAAIGEIGLATYVIICTKNYDLAQILQQLTPCIGVQTTILSLLNGVEATAKIRAAFPYHLVPDGCAYIVSAIEAPGIVTNIGHRQEIYFGLDNQTDKRLLVLEQLFRSAGINATLTQDISKVIWQKFIFLSCIATATSYFNKTIGQLLEVDKETLFQLLEEVSTIAIKNGINIDKDTKTKAMQHYNALPYDATSSMHRDYLNKKPITEIESLTGYVVREAEKLHISTPLFTKAYQYLLNQHQV